MKSYKTTFSDYSSKDTPAIKKHLANRCSELPFLLFGHSASGQLIGFLDELDNTKGCYIFDSIQVIFLI